MTYCPRCNRRLGGPDEPCNPPPSRFLVPANDNILRISLASDRYLRQPDTVHRIALGLKSVGLNRRQIPNWVADQIYHYDIEVRHKNGKIFDLHDTIVDDTFPDDLSCRWVSELLKFARHPPKQRAADKMLPRYRLLELALFLDGRIERPSRKRL
ncbi:MAG: hypothetical protein AAFV45_12720 [Pseudomonadota bacterium]